ncbi:MAG: hypothetical protein H7144_06725, partial [Burkholderiales bacterium]|nr:hypothetical protein [Phycisphaerae bacterium]
SRPTLLTRLFAPVLTIGAALWFPIVQPVLEIALARTFTEFSRETLLLVVQLLGASYLIKSVGFLMIYFFALWMWLRWLASRRILRALRRTTDDQHPAAAIITWAGRLIDPVERHAARLRALSARIDELTTRERSAA